MASTMPDPECEFHSQANKQQKRGNLRSKTSDNNINPRLYLIAMKARRGYSATDALEDQIRKIAADEDDEDTPRLKA